MPVVKRRSEMVKEIEEHEKEQAETAPPPLEVLHSPSAEGPDHSHMEVGSLQSTSFQGVGCQQQLRLHCRNPSFQVVGNSEQVHSYLRLYLCLRNASFQGVGHQQLCNG